MLSKKNRLVGAILLVSGTTIGAGMLALPVATGLAGFFPSLLIMTAIWLFMMLTAFYFLEVNLRIKEESNFISMMHKTLGRPGEIISWITYLLLLYTLTTAYLLGCSQIVHHFLSLFIPSLKPSWILLIAVFVFFAIFVYRGTEISDVLNRVMMLGLIFAYITIIGLGIWKVKLPMLTHIEWRYLLPSVSVVLTTFGYHIIIPTLTTYLEHDSRLLKQAIFIGSLIPFIVYVLWQILVMGVVPVYGQHSLMEASVDGMQVTFFLITFLNSHTIGIAIQIFAFFAIVTSLLGVSLSLVDFLADGLKIKKNSLGKCSLILLAFAPPLVFALFYPKGFLLALRYAGIFVVILLALLPSLMAWFERYGSRSQRLFTTSDFKVPGGKPLLGATIILSLILVGVEVFA